MPLAPYGRYYAAQRIYQGSSGPSAITQLWLALVTAEVLETSTVSTIVEVSAPSYTRVAVSLTGANTTISETGEGAFNDPVIFPTVAEDTWGDIVGYALCTSATPLVGEIFAYGTIPVTTPLAGDTPTVPAGTLTFSVTG